MEERHLTTTKHDLKNAVLNVQNLLGLLKSGVEIQTDPDKDELLGDASEAAEKLGQFIESLPADSGSDLGREVKQKR
jgi:light-regulated signal transduction histidine kinase (bacteriophytochrome)